MALQTLKDIANKRLYTALIRTTGWEIWNVYWPGLARNRPMVRYDEPCQRGELQKEVGPKSPKGRKGGALIINEIIA